MKILIKLLKIILIIALTITIIAISGIKILSSTILDEAYVFRHLRSGNYYSSIYEELKSNLENYIGPSGLDENVLADICTVENIEKDTETILGNIYEGTSRNVDTQYIQERIKTKIYEHLDNVTITSSVKENIDKFAEEISNEYINTISHTNYEESIYNAYQKAKKIIEYFRMILWIAGSAIISLIIIFSLKKIYTAPINIGMSFAASGAFLMLIRIIINQKTNLNHIRVLNDPISTVLQNMVKDIFSQINSYGLVVFIIGIILIILGNILKKEK